MSVKIRSIFIKNFRSVENLDADMSPLTVFVGKNDCGKSNILRALNLFFNNETNHGSPFNFEEDYNFFAPKLKRKAKEIVVRIEFDIPESYKKNNGDIIIWEKRWRKEGLVSGDSNYHGIKNKEKQRDQNVREKIVIPGRSNLHALLRKIEFEYVPAIKDARYFEQLRGRIYSLISEVASKSFKDSSTTFESSIGVQLSDLIQSINNTLGSINRLALPRDLSHIFEKLDFLSGDKSVSLDNRGDGIKARHIPLILQFMATKKNSLHGRGAIPSSFIWGYEEPENNLEFASAVALADEMVGYVDQNIAQALLTTHSPAFYDLAKKNDAIILHHVSKQSEKVGTSVSQDSSGLDESLGTLAMMAPRISDIVEDIRKREKAKLYAEDLLKKNRRIIFVEGESDAIILKRTLELFYSKYATAVDFKTKQSGGGINYVFDMLEQWRLGHKHHPEGPKAAGVVDRDATKKKNAFNKVQKITESAKCFSYKTPTHLHSALGSRYKILVDLEALYLPEIWAWADKNSHLELRKKRDVYSPEAIEKILSGQIDPNTVLHDDWKLYMASCH